MAKINGVEIEANGKTISQYLAGTDYSVARIAVERNGDIVPKAEYDNVTIEENDVIEVVSFVGGG